MMPINISDSPFGFAFKFIAKTKEQKEDTENYLKKSTKTPFIFLHGHKGNVKQAISMTTFFLKQDLDIDMFSIDFVEGAVAVSSTLTYAEAEYTVKCIKTV